MKSPTISSPGLAILAGISLVTPAFALVNIDYVSVGNGGNAADPATDSLYGAVAYEYKIAKNETTISQYTEFLNAAARVDSYGLYSTNMASDANSAGIQRSGSSGSYDYAAIGSSDRPITYVSWFDAARFVNWLHNGQGVGSTETGVYNLNGATSGIFTVQLGATVWLPTENEWHKAAYYDPTKNAGAGGYWLHANQSDTMTSNDPTEAGAANYFDSDFAVTQSGSYSPSQNYLTDVGAYGSDSESYYGTNDQAGNVWEWNDAVNGLSRGLRGGSWDSFDANPLASFSRGRGSASLETPSFGFRIASVPEPSCLVLTMLASGMMVARRKRS